MCKSRGFSSLKHNSLFRSFFSWLDSTGGSRPYHCWGFEITLRHTTHGRTPLDEWSARCRGFYPTTRNTHNRQTYEYTPTAGFEPTGGVKALNHAATGIGSTEVIFVQIKCASWHCIKIHAIYFFVKVKIRNETWASTTCLVFRNENGIIAELCSSFNFILGLRL